MVENTTFPVSSSSSRLATNDIYLAALLLSKDIALVKLIFYSLKTELLLYQSLTGAVLV